MLTFHAFLLRQDMSTVWFTAVLKQVLMCVCLTAQVMFAQAVSSCQTGVLFQCLHVPPSLYIWLHLCFLCLCMHTGHSHAGIWVCPEDESWHARHQPPRSAVLGVPTSHAALISSPGLHHYRWVYHQCRQSAGVGPQKHMCWQVWSPIIKLHGSHVWRAQGGGMPLTHTMDIN